jgi:hypothetical protein
VGRQDDETGVLLGQGEDLPAAVGELAAAPHPRDLATLEDLGSVGEVPAMSKGGMPGRLTRSDTDPGV